MRRARVSRDCSAMCLPLASAVMCSPLASAVMRSPLASNAINALRACPCGGCTVRNTIEFLRPWRCGWSAFSNPRGN
ncbi:hypothetical protein K438DRAFT_712591 [Mycena galopus ATCC 62051]|nr:hypothetical protein K438DRAFT_712591 [Mycena galopus ATCC 62051]